MKARRSLLPSFAMTRRETPPMARFVLTKPWKTYMAKNLRRASRFTCRRRFPHRSGKLNLQRSSSDSKTQRKSVIYSSKTSLRSGLVKICKHSLRILARSKASRYSLFNRVKGLLVLLSASKHLIVLLKHAPNFINSALVISSSLSPITSFLRLGKGCNSRLRTGLTSRR